MTRPIIPEPTHRHVKRGTEYVLIGYGKMQTENWVVLNPSPKWEAGFEGRIHGYHGKAADMQEIAIYQSVDDGSLWARPREEFEDGRFVALGTGE